MSVVPKEINYAPKNALPSGTKNTQNVISPSNGQTFSPGQIITFDLPSVGYLVPETLLIRYNLAVTNGATGTSLKGCPAFIPFQNLQTLIGSQIVENITNYNLLGHLLINTKMNISQKWGNQFSLGYTDLTTDVTSANCNGRTIPASATTTIPLAAPLGNILSNAENLIPLGMMPAVRIQLTVESIANMLFGGAGTVTAVTLSNLELVFDNITFGDEIDAVVRSQADASGMITLKSQSYVISGQTVASGTGGQIELVYNQRLSSIKAAIASFGKNSNNTFIDSVDMTKGGGDYSFNIGGIQYPQRALSTYINRAGCFAELMQIWSPAHDLFTTSSSITTQQYMYNSNDATTVTEPGMVWIGTNLERLSSNGVLLSGISSALSPISLRVNFGSNTSSETHTAFLILHYDALIMIDVVNRMVVVKQ